ncbi:MAG: 1,4-alpha-glucan branching protein [Streptosporangiaceae bacterium]|nr:1,4-alpha-glucan branching protein [Streptosporangiaceae bacterium]MBV9853641.1 1,4-alpha-glucan branching protein [Streptosporangiaceae bacterium]
MAIIHNTTMSPGKLELLTAWLPAQPWYRGSGRQPRLTRAGGFRLDDPQGEVGIEFMAVTDVSGDRATTYQVPLTYRGRALAGASGALIGTAEHGVLRRRWIYDGTHDPVLVAQLVALMRGEAEPQAQRVSNTADPSVTSQPVLSSSLTVTKSAATLSGPFGTDLQVETADADGSRSGQLTVRVKRILQPAGDRAQASEAGQPCLSGTWRLPNGAQTRGVFVTAWYAQPPAVEP